jgi:hippurate hydrolase
MQEQPGVSPEHDPMSIPYPSQGETVTQPESVRRDTAAPAAPAPAAGAGHADAALIAKVKAEIDADAARLTGIFKDIHEHPELGFMETRTADIVARELKALGFEVTTGIGKTGVVGILRNGDDPTVMYRADMDANAVEEATGLPYASKVRGHRGDGKEVPVGHMCGHDAHVTWMLGMAKALVAAKADWHGTLILVGQPAEELGAGAKAMVDDGLYERYGVPVPDYLYGLHTAPLPTGTLISGSGARMAGTDLIDVTFHGIGGHGSSPQTTKDPIIMAALAIVEYQMIISRAIDPQEAAVLTVGSVQAGNDNNVIPSEALVKINLRWFKPAVREQLVKGIENINRSIASAYGLPDHLLPTMTMKGSVPPLINDASLVERINVPLKRELGEQRVLTDFPALMGSEDCQMLMGDKQSIKLAYLQVGTAPPKIFAQARAEGKFIPFSNHNPDYQVDLDAIPLGAKLAAVGVLEMLASPTL